MDLTPLSRLAVGAIRADCDAFLKSGPRLGDLASYAGVLEDIREALWAEYEEVERMRLAVLARFTAEMNTIAKGSSVPA